MAVVSAVATDSGSRFGDSIYWSYVYTFTSGHLVEDLVLNEQDQAWNDAACTARISEVEQSVYQAAFEETYSNFEKLDETHIPVMPDHLPASDADLTVDTRRRQFHRWLYRRVWPETLIEVTNKWSRVWDWVGTQGATPGQQDYLDVTVQQWNTLSARSNDAITIREFTDADVPGEFE
jgi:hypothetical protein